MSEQEREPEGAVAEQAATAGDREATAERGAAPEQAGVSADGDAEAGEGAEPETALEVRRQSLSTRGGACDTRVGPGAVDDLGRALLVAVGKPRRALLVVDPDAPSDFVELARRSLTDSGFEAFRLDAPAGRAARGLEFVMRAYSELDARGITADDAVVGVGGADLMSALSFIGGTWCAGTVCAIVPTGLDGMVEVPVTPRAVDLGESPSMLATPSVAKLAVCDTSLCDASAQDASAPDEATLRGRVSMVASALTYGERSFSELAVAAPRLATLEPAEVQAQVLDLSKARSRTANSSSLAVRQGLAYGSELALALADVLGRDGSDAELQAEGMRFASRLGVAVCDCDPELAFAQDGLLEELGLAELACDVDATELLEALKASGLKRSNRFLFALPHGFGRVRLTSVPDETLAQHVQAWCRTRKRLLRRRSRA